MLVVEGPPLAGRTTLCDTLAQKCREIALTEMNCIGENCKRCDGKGCAQAIARMHSNERAAWSANDFKGAIRPWCVVDGFFLSKIAGADKPLSRRSATKILSAVKEVGGMLIVLCATERAYDAMLDRRWIKSMPPKNELRAMNRAFLEMADGKWADWYMVSRMVLPRLVRGGDKLFHALENEHEVNAIARGYCAGKRWFDPSIRECPKCGGDTQKHKHGLVCVNVECGHLISLAQEPKSTKKGRDR